jgi:hypothetical protein
MTKRKTGYLANVLSIPPLIFRFQFNPELLSEKKSFEYRESNAFGKWEFDRGAADPGFLGFIGGLDDVKEWGSLLVGTKPQEAVAGKPRTFSLDFALDARKPPDIPDPTTPPPLATRPNYHHRVTGAEDIEYLAWRFFNASDLWWRIADANPVRFPLDLRPGDAIEIPSNDDFGRIVSRERRF